VSRRLDRPLSVLILSSSGAGKSALQNVTLGFCPPEDVVRLTSLTGRALFYQEPASLRHRVLALSETAGGEQAAYAIRSLISEGELVVSTTVRDRNSGRLTTEEHRVEGPTAVFCTTTHPDIDPETRSRFFVIGVDESAEQTARVLAWQRRQESAPDAAGEEDIAAIRRLHRNFQRLLRPLRVINPFAPQLTYGAVRLQSRRDQPRYLALIGAVAYLRQMARTARTTCIDGVEVDYIEVELDDIAVANRVAEAALGPSVGDLSLPARNLLAALGELARERLGHLGVHEGDPTTITFTRRDIREFSGWNHSRLHNHLNELLELQYVVLESRGYAGGHRYRLSHVPASVPTAMESLGLKPVETLRQELGPVPDSPESTPVPPESRCAGSAATHVTSVTNSAGFQNPGIPGEHERCGKTPIS